MRNSISAAAIGLAVGIGLLAAPASPVRADGPAGGQVTFQMNRIDSVRDYFTRYFGQVPPYRERGDEDLQDSVARCLFAYGELKAKRFDTVILYAGRDPHEPSNLICNVFPIDEAAHMRLCEGIGMSYISTDETRYELTCGVKPDSVGMTR
jgi:hypothetical protein